MREERRRDWFVKTVSGVTGARSQGQSQGLLPAGSWPSLRTDAEPSTQLCGFRCVTGPFCAPASSSQYLVRTPCFPGSLATLNELL